MRLRVCVRRRFRVPDGEVITFDDARAGRVSFTAGVDFGDFVVWRRDDVPAYELACVVDDYAMGVTGALFENWFKIGLKVMQVFVDRPPAAAAPISCSFQTVCPILLHTI